MLLYKGPDTVVAAPDGPQSGAVRALLAQAVAATSGGVPSTTQP